jgi:hypothetical protein
MINDNWLNVHEPLSEKSAFFIRNRTIITMFYLTHPGSLAEAAALFGMNKTTAFRSVKQIVDVLVTSILPSNIRLPQSNLEWDAVAMGFEKICGFPNCCLAIDGNLFEIERPYEGWYCRKGFLPSMSNSSWITR